MKKHLLSLLFLSLSFVFLTKSALSQSWVDLMQDPSVNFYDVQKAFNKTFHKAEKEMGHEHYMAFKEAQKLQEKNANKGIMQIPLKGQAIQGDGKEEKEDELPGWEIYKRWESYMAPRLFPSGDRSVMINAMNEYFDNYYSGSGDHHYRAMGGATPAPAAANWTLIGPTTTIPSGAGGAGRVNFVRFDPTTTNTIYVGSPGGGLWKSTTGGTSWSTNTDNLAVIGCTDVAIDPTNTQNMYLATGDGEASDTYSIGVLKSTNGGTTWSPSGLTWLVTNGRTISRLLMNPQNPNTIFAATSNGVYRTRNAGAAWTQIASAVANIKDIEFKPGDTTTVYACSTTLFYRSTNAGTSFVTTATGLPAAASLSRLAIAVTAAASADVYVLAANTAYGFQGLYLSTNSGVGFSTVSTTPNILGYSNTGATAGGQGWYDLSIAVSPTNASLVIVGGVDIWKSTNGGSTWTLNAEWTGSGAPYVHADIHALEFLPASATTYFAGCDGGFFKTSNTGTAWSDLSNGLQISEAYRIGLSTTNANLLNTGWQDNGTARWTGTSSWTRPLGGDGMEAIVDWSNANVQYGELYYGDIRKTTTGGNYTTQIVTSGGTAGTVNADGDWVTPYIEAPSNAATLFVGKSQVFKSINSGGTWTQVGTVSGGTGNIIALANAASNINYIYAAKMDKFYVSTTGTTFVDRTAGLPVASASISYIAVHNTNPNRVWVTFSGYSAANKVWYSADAGVTWTNYSTGLPNLPANCIVYQNGSANESMYVGTDVGVYYRDNTAGSWAAYNTGLPNVSVRELEIQYTAAKLRAATFGRCIWQSDLYTPGAALPVADFSANRTNICVGDCINFTDLSTGSPTSWSWSFPGAATTSSTVQNPTGICYSTAGTYAVTLIATNINGSNTITKTAYITVSGVIALPLVEGFQSTYVPAGWSLNNPDADNTWAQSTAAGGFGTSTQSAVMDNLTPATTIAGTIDELWTPKYNFTSVATASLTFDVAYARYNATYTDSLRVFVSTDCGTTWTAVYNKGGFTGLQTAPDNSTSSFVPTAGQWRTETVSMTPYAGQASVMVKFQNYSGWGQMMYLDNINITAAGAPVASVTIAETAGTNPMCAGASATFTATPINGGTTPTYQWQVNGVNVGGATSSTWTTTTLTNGQVVTCVMTSNLVGVTGSPATSNSITMTVNPIPATPAPSSNSPVCAGTAINLTTSAVAGATYNWTGPGAFSNTLQNPVRAGATPAMAGTYSLTVTVNGCTSIMGTTTVIVNPVPAAPTAGSNTPVCSGSVINLTTSTVAGATYSWTGPNAFTSVLQNPSTAASTAAMAGTYSVTVTVGGCTSAVGTTTVVVNPSPAMPTAGSNSPVCAGATINLTTPAVAGATYSWTGPAAFSSSLQNPTRTASTVAMSGTYSVTVTAAGCTSPVGTVSVIVNPVPATPTAGSNSPVCAGTIINLTTPTVAGSTYSWTGPNSFTSTLQNPSTGAATTAMAGTYSVTVTSAAGCTSSVGTNTVVVNTTPATPTAGSNSPVCMGSVINLTTPATVGTYSWTGPNAFTSTNQNPSTGASTAAMAGTYSVTVTSSGCTSAAGTTTVVVNALPATPTAASNTPVCSGTAINLTTPTVAGATYSWTGPAVFSSTLQNPSRAGATAAMGGAYSVTVTVGGCTSLAGTTAVVIKTTPAAPVPTINGSTTPAAICAGGTITLLTPTVAGATYSWTGPNSYSAAVRNPPALTSATTAMAGTYSVTVTVGGCTSNPGTVSIVVNPTVVPSVNITASPSGAICSGQSVTFTATPTNGGTTPSYQWKVNGSNVGTNSPTYTSTTLTNGQIVTCVLTSNAACASPATGTSNSITMVVNTTLIPAVSIAVTGGSNPGCAGSNVTFTATPTNGGATPAYQWQVNGSNVGTSSATFSSTTLTSGQVVTCVLTSSSTCASPATATSSGITMTVNPIPATPTAGSSSPVCSGTVIDLTTPTVAGATYSWTGPNTFVSAVQNPSTTASTSAMAGTYSVTITSSGCTSIAGTTTVIVNTTVTPAISITPSPTGAICPGTSVTFTAAATNGGATPAYQWQINGSNIGTGGATYTSTSLTNSDVVTCILTSNATCASPVTASSGGITMTVNAAAASSVTITDAPSGAICQGDSVVFTATPINGGATPIYQWQVNGSNVGTNSTSFTSASLNNSDVVTCILTSSATCATPTNATSNSLTMTVNPVPATPTITQSGSVLTSSATTGNQWYLNGVIIAGATGQNYTFTSNGSYTVVVTLGSCSSTSVPTVILNVGIADPANPNVLTVYPNPNDGNFTLSFFSSVKSTFKVEIENALGQRIYKEEVTDFTGTYSKRLSVIEFGQGVYTISLTNAKNETVKKIVVY